MIHGIGSIAKKLQIPAFGLWSLLLSGVSLANDTGANGLYEFLTGGSLQDSGVAKTLGLVVGGWADTGYTYNPANGDNQPVSFNFRANEWNLQQLDIFLEKPLSTDMAEWSVGGRFDFMFGTDTPYTQARGHWDSRLIGDDTLRFYKIALPQAYLDIRAPLGNGLSARIGHFYSILGYESVASPPNFFYSHSYSMKSSPFTHTGVLLSYQPTDNLTLYSGAVTGPDNFDDQFGAWSYLGGMAWKLPSGGSLAFSILHGDTRETVADTLTYYSTVLQYPLTDKLAYVLQHDGGVQDHATAQGRTAAWYSVVQYLTWQYLETLGLGARAEWFRDQDGVRYGYADTGYYGLTLGLNWKPLGWLAVRPEVRYDWADGPVKVYGDGTKNQQWLLGADFVVQF